MELHTYLQLALKDDYADFMMFLTNLLQKNARPIVIYGTQATGKTTIYKIYKNIINRYNIPVKHMDEFPYSTRNLLLVTADLELFHALSKHFKGLTLHYVSNLGAISITDQSVDNLLQHLGYVHTNHKEVII